LIPKNEISKYIPKLLNQIQENLLNKAKGFKSLYSHENKKGEDIFWRDHNPLE
jgi:hypothetical protein